VTAVHTEQKPTTVPWGRSLFGRIKCRLERVILCRLRRFLPMNRRARPYTEDAAYGYHFPPRHLGGLVTGRHERRRRKGSARSFPTPPHAWLVQDYGYRKPISWRRHFGAAARRRLNATSLSLSWTPHSHPQAAPSAACGWWIRHVCAT